MQGKGACKQGTHCGVDPDDINSSGQLNVLFHGCKDVIFCRRRKPSVHVLLHACMHAVLLPSAATTLTLLRLWAFKRARKALMYSGVYESSFQMPAGKEANDPLTACLQACTLTDVIQGDAMLTLHPEHVVHVVLSTPWREVGAVACRGQGQASVS